MTHRDLPDDGTFRLGGRLVEPTLHRIEGAAGDAVPVEPKVMQVLLRLARQPGRVVSRDQLMASVWAGETVTEHALSRCVSALRKVFDDDAEQPRFIETIRKGGYRLIADLTPADDAAGSRSERRAPGARSQRRATSAVVLVLGATAIAAIIAARWSRAPPSPRPAALSPATSLRGSELDPALAPDGRALAFAWSGPADDNFDIYVKALPASEPRRLTVHPAEDTNPAWSPDGERIAFVRSGPETQGIYAVSVLGDAARKLVDTGSGDIPDLAWSRDGSSLVYSDRVDADRSDADRSDADRSDADRSDAPPPTAIHVYDLATAERRAITAPPDGMAGDRDLALSPRGDRVAFARASVRGIEDLYVQAIDGGAGRRLTFDQTSINGIAWAADGRSILFSSARGLSSAIWRIDAEGGDPVALQDLGDGAFDPHVSAAGTRLVFERKRFDANIWRLDLDGSRRIELTIGSTRWDAAPALAPDATRVAFVSDRGGKSAIWIANVDGSQPFRPVISDREPIGVPSWSPDGSRLVFALRDAGGSDLFEVDARGGEPRRLTADPWHDEAPTYAADGDTIYFTSDRSGDWQIWRIPSAGGKPTRVTDGGGYRARASADGTALWVSRFALPGIERLPIHGRGAPVARRATPAGAELRMAADWDLAGTTAVLRALAAHPPTSFSLVEIDLTTGRRTTLSAALDGLDLPGLGLTVASDRSFLLFGWLEDDDSDIVLAEAPDPF